MALLRKRYFLIPRENWKGILGGALAFLVTMGVISWGAAKGALETTVAKQAADEIVQLRDRARDHVASLGAAFPLAALTVREGAVVSNSKDVKYDRATGVVTFPNPKNLRFVPIVSDLAQKSSTDYITETHFIREIGTTNQFRVWSKTLDTGGRNNPPSNFTAIVIGIP